jgi:diguanylate cyclase (GGDEF)-like protein
MTSLTVPFRGQPRQSLGRWTLVRMAALLLGIGTLFLAVSIYKLDQRFDAFDAEQYRQEVIRVAVALKQDQSALEGSLGDYAHWDDTYSFVETRNARYIPSNFTGESVANLRINTVFILNKNGQFIAGRNLTRDGTFTEISPRQLSALMPLIDLQSLNAPEGQATQLHWLGQEPVLIAASKISDTARKKTANGIIVMVRNFDTHYLSKMRIATAVAFSIQPTRVQSEAIFSNDEQSGQWNIKQNLPHMPAAIGVAGATRLQSERLFSTIALVGNAVVLILLSLLGIYWVLKRRVLSRLSTFSQLADRHRVERDPAIRWPVQGNDELDNLGLALNELMGEVEVRHAELSHQAQHDPLTQIGNRRMLMDRLEAVRNRCARVPTLSSSLLLVDLDGFKMINDGMGHAAGDQVLKVVADRAVALVRNYDTATRLGGDEFAILLEDADPEHVLPFAQRLLTAIEQPIRFKDHDLTIRASIGIAAVDGTLSSEDVLRNADLAMYEAKRRGKGQAAIFDTGLLDSATRRVQLEQALQRALDNNQLEVWFQPIVNPLTGEVKGMEALTRWPFNGGYVPPDEFIQIAESNGMIAQLGRLVFKQVGLAMMALRREYPSLTCNINLSVRQFRDADLVAELLEFTRAYSLPITAVHLELTESMVAESKDDILPTMLELVGRGYRFHLDDFGTGFSSLDRLRELPFDTLKVDRSFVTPLNTGDDVMARHIIGMAHDLGMDVIAEGVETQAELDRLIELGCTQIQGYYFARPMPLHDLRIWLKNQRRKTHKAALQAA